MKNESTKNETKVLNNREAELQEAEKALQGLTDAEVDAVVTGAGSTFGQWEEAQ